MRRGVSVLPLVGAEMLSLVMRGVRRREPAGDVALICGGSRGLGLLIADELAARGFRKDWHWITQNWRRASWEVCPTHFRACT